MIKIEHFQSATFAFHLFNKLSLLHRAKGIIHITMNTLTACSYWIWLISTKAHGITPLMAIIWTLTMRISNLHKYKYSVKREEWEECVSNERMLFWKAWGKHTISVTIQAILNIWTQSRDGNWNTIARLHKNIYVRHTS
jgi:hypothetical protein